MSEHLVTSLTSIAAAIVGVAIIAVLVSQRANTSQVITSAGGAFAETLGAAVSPVTGGGSGFGGFSGQGAPIASYHF